MKNCDCIHCKNNHKFGMPSEILDDFVSGRVTIFAGAGISTESRTVIPETFYDEVAQELNIENCQLPFPELMEKYCSKINGRIKLLTKIRNRFKYVESFSNLKDNSTRFHQELATLFMAKTIITTNWDMYFEEVCNATPFVSDEDLVFWENEDRRVLKIHGSINNYGSIVATTSDYAKCQKRLNNNLIGGILKTLFATQTIIFIGYSLNDSDFQNIWGFVSEQMEGLQRQAFVVTPFENEQERFKDIGLIPIITDGSFFLSQIKQHFISTGSMLSDDIYCKAERMLSTLKKVHAGTIELYDCSDHPQTIINSCYQDGMIQALNRAITLRGSGEYSNLYIYRGLIEFYLKFKKERLRAKRYENVAYIEGYLAGLYSLLPINENEQEMEPPPLFFAFGAEELHTINAYDNIINDLPNLHKASYLYTKKMVKKLSSTKGMCFQHPPWFS